MKKAIYLFIPFALFSCGGGESEEETTEGAIDSTDIEVPLEEEVVERKSPRIQETGTVYGLAIDLDYGSPRVRDREIWGDLVPYDKVWRAGADEVSAITFGAPAFFGGSQVDAGTYGMFIIPKEEGDWTFILNEEWSQEEHGVWGAYDYKEEKDVLRINVTPEWMEESQEEMFYTVTTDGELMFAWEKVVLKITIGPVEPA